MTLDGYYICTNVRYQTYTICRWHLLDIIPVVIKSKAIFDWYFLCILTGLEIENKKSLMNFTILFFYLSYVTVVYVNITLCYIRNQSRLSTLKRQPRLATMKPREWPVCWDNSRSTLTGIQTKWCKTLCFLFFKRRHTIQSKLLSEG